MNTIGMVGCIIMRKLLKTLAQVKEENNKVIPTKYVNGDDPSKLPSDPIPRKAAASVEKTFGE